MSPPEPFAVHDCNLARIATGVVCSNLRELLQAVRTLPDGVLEHHMMRCALEDYFELYEFPNDLARWCWSALGDHPLGEALALVDPYRLASIDAVRTTIADLIDERLWSADRVPWSRPGLELPLMESRLIAFDTGERINTPAALVEAIRRMPLRSLFYHVHEARRRTRGESDDFSSWLDAVGVGRALTDRLRNIDFYFLNLSQLRREILDVFDRCLVEASSSPAASTRA